MAQLARLQAGQLRMRCFVLVTQPFLMPGRRSSLATLASAEADLDLIACEMTLLAEAAGGVLTPRHPQTVGRPAPRGSRAGSLAARQ